MVSLRNPTEKVVPACNPLASLDQGRAMSQSSIRIACPLHTRHAMDQWRYLLLSRLTPVTDTSLMLFFSKPSSSEVSILDSSTCVSV